MDILKEYFSFKGTAARTDYWYIVVIGALVHFLIGKLDIFLAKNLVNNIQLAIGVPLAWAVIATTARRFRDMGKSAWWTLLLLVPVIGALVVLLMCAFKQGAANKTS